MFSYIIKNKLKNNINYNYLTAYNKIERKMRYKKYNHGKKEHKNINIHII